MANRGLETYLQTEFFPAQEAHVRNQISDLQDLKGRFRILQFVTNLGLSALAVSSMFTPAARSTFAYSQDHFQDQGKIFAEKNVDPADLRVTLKEQAEILSKLKIVDSTITTEQGFIVPVGYEMSRASHRSYPWLPKSPEREGEEATGLNEGGPANDYDIIDIWQNGSYSKAALRQELTRDFLLRANRELLAAGVDISWTGDCRDAAAASWFAPKISGSTVVNGVLFTEKERMVIAVWQFGGLAMDPYYPHMNDEAISAMGAYIANGEPFVVNWSDNENQEWWGIATGISPDGNVVITRHLRWNEFGEEGQVGNQLKIEHKLVRAGGVLRLDRPHPGFEGSFDRVNKPVAGLVTGTHRLE